MSKDHAWAGLLNGVMFIALGAAFPAFLLWQTLNAWQSGIIARSAYGDPSA